MRTTLFYLFAFLHLSAAAQMAEVYAGHQRAGVDIMWFKNVNSKKEERTPFLFFSRNRASVSSANSPALFGSTNAVSYNFKNGVGVVIVASFLNAGFTPKAGIQYFRQRGNFMFFGWLVADLKAKGTVDMFGLFRYQPKINDQWNLFTQMELFPVFVPSADTWNLTQRIRLGARYQSWAGGWMLDLNQYGKSSWTATKNTGAFIRYEF